VRRRVQQRRRGYLHLSQDRDALVFFDLFPGHAANRCAQLRQSCRYRGIAGLQQTFSDTDIHASIERRIREKIIGNGGEQFDISVCCCWCSLLLRSRTTSGK
jgi:hypothetical protein